MKNIKQQIDIAAEANNDSIPSPQSVYFDGDMKGWGSKNFKEGANFALSLLLPILKDATKWISIDDREKKMPDDPFLIKLEDGSIYRNDDDQAWQWKMMLVTHWRPIEIENINELLTQITNDKQ